MDGVEEMLTDLCAGGEIVGGDAVVDLAFEGDEALEDGLSRGIVFQVPVEVRKL